LADILANFLTRTNAMRPPILRAAWIAAAVLSSSPLLGEQSEVVEIKVPYGDLDLTQTRDLQTLHLRVGRAIRGICGTEADVRYLQLANVVEACRTGALKQAHSKIMVLSAEARQGHASAAGDGLRLALSLKP
jgi:UrcA family protein